MRATDFYQHIKNTTHFTPHTLKTLLILIAYLLVISYFVIFLFNFWLTFRFFPLFTDSSTGAYYSQLLIITIEEILLFSVLIGNGVTACLTDLEKTPFTIGSLLDSFYYVYSLRYLILLNVVTEILAFSLGMLMPDYSTVFQCAEIMVIIYLSLFAAPLILDKKYPTFAALRASVGALATPPGQHSYLFFLTLMCPLFIINIFYDNLLLNPPSLLGTAIYLTLATPLLFNSIIIQYRCLFCSAKQST